MVFECCALPIKVETGLLLSLFSDFINGFSGRDLVFLTRNPRRFRFLVEDWASKANIRLSRRMSAYVYGGSNLWVVDPSEELPTSLYHRLVITDAHLLSNLVASSHLSRAQEWRVSGQFAERSHWFYSFVREHPHRRVHAQPFKSSPAVDRAYKLAQSSMEERRFRRLIHLEDVESGLSPFLPFARKRLTIRDKQANLVPFIPTKVQRRVLAQERWLQRNARVDGTALKILVLKSRREGITTLQQAVSYQDSAELSNRMNVTLAHVAPATNRIFRIAQLMHERDPYGPSLRGVGNAQRLEFPDLNSLFFLGTAGSVGFGRGDTLQRVHCSEVSKWLRGPRQIEKVDDLVAGLIEAASHGSVVFETTPDGVEWFAHKWRESKSGQNDYHRIFLPWFISPFNRLEADVEEIRDTITTEETELVKKHSLDFRQIAWRRSKKSSLKVLFNQEYPEDDSSCFLTSGTLYFDVDLIEQIARNIEKPREERMGSGTLFTWKEPEPGRRYVAGSDTSEGLGAGDANGISIVDHETGEDAAFLYGRMSMEEQADLGTKLATKYNRALWLIERNNTSGGAVVRRVQDSGYKHLFEFQKGRAGWQTTAATRPILIDEFAQFVNDHPDRMKSQIVLDEMMTFRLQPNGKFEHDPGCHDDALFCRMLANEGRRHRANRPRITVV